jgi:pilus assembly protein Flp/PilA
LQAGFPVSRVLTLKTIGDRKMKTIRKFIKNNKGATAIEYGLIAALIAVAAIAAMQGLGNQLKTTFGNVTSNMKAS